MTLLKCHQCGTEFSKTAMVCRSCGAKTKRPSTALEKFVLIGAGLVFLVPMVFFVVSRMDNKPAAVTEMQVEAPADTQAPAPTAAE